MLQEYIQELAFPRVRIQYPEDEPEAQFREFYGYFREVEDMRLEYVESVLNLDEKARQAHVIELQRARAGIVDHGVVGRADLRKIYPEIKDMPWFCFCVVIHKYELTEEQIAALRPDGWAYLVEYGLCLSVERAIQTLVGESDSDEVVTRPIENCPIVVDNPNIEIITGTQGLADFIGCSKSMAFAIIDSGILKAEGIQYRVGRCWKFNGKRLEKYLTEHPEILSRVRCKR